MDRPPVALPDVVLRYDNLALSVKIPNQGKQGSGFDTVAGKLLGAPRALLRRFYAARGSDPLSREVKVLDNVSGIVLPGRMTLVLGAPGAAGGAGMWCLRQHKLSMFTPMYAGSGKSSYLKALTSRLANQRQLRGVVRYSGLTAAEAASRWGFQKAVGVNVPIGLLLSRFSLQGNSARSARPVRFTARRTLPSSYRPGNADFRRAQQVNIAHISGSIATGTRRSCD